MSLPAPPSPPYYYHHHYCYCCCCFHVPSCSSSFSCCCCCSPPPLHPPRPATCCLPDSYHPALPPFLPPVPKPNECLAEPREVACPSPHPLLPLLLPLLPLLHILDCVILMKGSCCCVRVCVLLFLVTPSSIAFFSPPALRLVRVRWWSSPPYALELYKGGGEGAGRICPHFFGGVPLLPV